jgi:hypothetical protein
MRNCLIASDDGTQRWCLNGKLHREDGPAIIYADGARCWYQNDELHREDGPAIIYADGTQHWYLNNKRHREDGPAIIYADGTQHWFLNNKRHREDGPAVIRPDGYQEWCLYLNDTQISLTDGVLRIGRWRPVELADPDSKDRIRRILKRRKITPVGWLAELVK